MKPTLKSLGTKRLKLQYDEPVSIFVSIFSLRRYSEGLDPARRNGQAQGTGLKP